MNVYDILKERGFIAEVTDEEALRKLLSEEQVTFYIGFDVYIFDVILESIH